MVEMLKFLGAAFVALAIVLCIVVVCISVIGGGYAYLEARQINKLFGTAYTARDMMFAGDLIRQKMIGSKNQLDVYHH